MPQVRLTRYARGGGCACKIPPGELEEMVAGLSPGGGSAELLVGLENGDDAAVVRLDPATGIVATADFFTPVVDDPYDWGRIAATNALSDVYAMGGTPLVALNLLCWPRDVLPMEVAREVLRGGRDVARAAGCHLAGGHSIDDDGPKYLNTPETPIYKKSHVLYGIDQAKREIAKQGRAVIVEGYTDVMACHLAGVTTAVATCGTAFGADHISVLRRLLMDTDAVAGEIIFTFDGDAAGQKAALRAFADDQRFVGRTFIAVSPDNMDPCDLRLARGDLAVRDLVARREPLVDFALRQVLRRYDLDTVDGRVEAMRAAAPLVAKLKDREKRPEYVRKLAGDLGMEIEPVQRAVLAAANAPAAGADNRPAPQPRAGRTAPVVDNPRSLVEREALKLALQVPVLAGPMFDAVGAEEYLHPVHQVLREAIAKAGGAAAATGGAVWTEAVRDVCDDLAAQALVAELAVEPLRIDGEPDPRYVSITLARLQWGSVTSRIRELKSKIQRINPVANKDEYFALFGELLSLEQQARGLREQAAGGL